MGELLAGACVTLKSVLRLFVLLLRLAGACVTGHHGFKFESMRKILAGACVTLKGWGCPSVSGHLAGRYETRWQGSDLESSPWPSRAENSAVVPAFASSTMNARWGRARWLSFEPSSETSGQASHPLGFQIWLGLARTRVLFRKLGAARRAEC